MLWRTKLVLHDEARKLADVLAKRRIRVVLAESCTAGLASAALAQVPGISQWHCGAAVTYREATKQAWLDVSSSDLAQYTAVSDPVARQMAVGVLSKTPEAEFAASITGHLGPNAPKGFDGIALIAVASRTGVCVNVLDVHRIALRSSGRIDRQNEAAAAVLRHLRQAIQSPG